MKKILLVVLAIVWSCSMQSSVNAHEYNPYQETYQQIAQNELVQGRVQFVYVLKNASGGPLTDASLKYLDYAGQEQSVKADAQGRVRLVFLQGKPFVQVREVLLGQQVYPVVGRAIVACAERQDFKKGLVNYYVLQKDMDKQVIHIYAAD